MSTDEAVQAGLVVRLTEYWRQNGISWNPPVLEHDLRGLEQRLHHDVPAPLRALFQRIGGQSEGAIAVGVADRHIRLWSISELQTADAGPFGSCLAFADWLLCSEEYAMELASPHRILTLRGDASVVVAMGLDDVLSAELLGRVPLRSLA